MARSGISSKVRMLALALMVSTALTAATTAITLASTPPQAGQAAKAAVQSSFTISINAQLTIRPDRTSEEIATTRIKVLGEAALQTVGQQMLAFVDGMQTLDVIEAYTEKEDGRRIPVDAASIITRDGASGVMMLFLDVKVRTVIFPDLAVGDTVVLLTREQSKAGMFSGHFVKAVPLLRMVPFADSSLTIVAPKSIGLKVAADGTGLERTVTEDGETVTHAITYKPLPKLVIEEPGITSVVDRDPRILISTFKSYEDMGRAYWAEAAPKAAATPEIAALAEQITAGITDRRAQAEAISRWVKRNIRYVAIYLGTARVVPNPAATVLSRKYGDCKDHVTLMSALLAAKGIDGEQVLIQSGNAYTMPNPPTMAYINHVIMYLPEFKTYDDPTVSLAGFGVLDSGSYDKPVIHASASGVHLARTPAMRPEDHTVINRSKIAIAADGTITGTTTEIGTGVFATGLRGMAARIQHDGLETTAQRQLRNNGWPGRGRFELGKPGDLGESYTLTSNFTVAKPIQLEPGKTAPIPHGLGTRVRPGEYLLSRRYDDRTLPFVCYSGRMIEELEVTFADALPLPRDIKPVSLANRWFTYTANYKLDGRTLTIRREFMTHVPGQVCGPEVEKDVSKLLKQVSDSVRVRMAFAPPPKKDPAVAKPDAPPPAVESKVEPGTDRRASADGAPRVN